MNETMKCPMCAEEIDSGAKKCPICKSDLETPAVDPIDAVVEPTFNFVWKNIVTAGFYSVLWLNRFRWCAGEAMDRVRMTSGMVNALMYTIGGAALLYTVLFADVSQIIHLDTGEPVIVGGDPVYSLGIGENLYWLAQLCAMVSGIICIRIAFLLCSYVKDKAARLGLTDYRMNTFLLVIFNLFYINYCLVELKNRSAQSKQ